MELLQFKHMHTHKDRQQEHRVSIQVQARIPTYQQTHKTQELEVRGEVLIGITLTHTPARAYDEVHHRGKWEVNHKNPGSTYENPQTSKLRSERLACDAMGLINPNYTHKGRMRSTGETPTHQTHKSITPNPWFRSTEGDMLVWNTNIPTTKGWGWELAQGQMGN
jgi:hypothetical protein